MADVRVSESYDEVIGGRVLHFRTDFGERTAQVYPEHWFELTDEQLQRISDRAPD
jgi:hypothetical protein